MPSSNRIIRGAAAAALPSWSIDPVGSKYNSKTDRLLTELSKIMGENTPAPRELTPEEKALIARSRALDEREAAIAELEQKTLQQAEETGLQRGYEAGWDAAHQERTALIKMAETLQEEFNDFKVNLAEKVLDLALLVSKKVIGDTVKLHPEHASVALNELMREMDLQPSSVTLLAHPETLKVIESQLGDTQEISGIKLQADPQQINGGFVLKHPEGEVNADLQSRWLRVIENLGRDMPLEPDEV